MNEDLMDLDFSSTSHDELPKNLARTLYDYATSQGWKIDRHRRGASELRRLIDTHGETVVIKRVNDYVKHQITRPRVVCCQDFREQWDWIGEMIRKAESVSCSTVSAEAKEIVMELMPENWPELAHKAFPAAVQNSLDNFRTYRKALSVAFADQECEHLRQHIREEFGEPVEFVRQWWIPIVAVLSSGLTVASGWKGDLSRHVWHTGHSVHIERIREMVADYGSSSRVFQTLVKVGTK